MLLAGDPGAGQAGLIAVVVQRDHPVDQGLDQVAMVAVVLHGGHGVDLAVADGEAVLAVVGLGVPAVEDREVQPAVEDDLLA